MENLFIIIILKNGIPVEAHGLDKNCLPIFEEFCDEEREERVEVHDLKKDEYFDISLNDIDYKATQLLCNL